MPSQYRYLSSWFCIPGTQGSKCKSARTIRLETLGRPDVDDRLDPPNACRKSSRLLQAISDKAFRDPTAVLLGTSYPLHRSCCTVMRDSEFSLGNKGPILVILSRPLSARFIRSPVPCDRSLLKLRRSSRTSVPC